MQILEFPPQTQKIDRLHASQDGVDNNPHPSESTSPSQMEEENWKMQIKHPPLCSIMGFSYRRKVLRQLPSHSIRNSEVAAEERRD